MLVFFQLKRKFIEQKWTHLFYSKEKKKKNKTKEEKQNKTKNV